MAGPNELDVAEAMQQIRRKVRAQRQGKAPEPRKAPTSGVLVSQERLGEAMDEVARAAHEVNLRWEVQESPFVSHVPLIGPVIAGFREAWNSVASKWHVRRILQQQVQFNRSVAQLALRLEVLGRHVDYELKAIDHSMRALVPAVDESTQDLEQRLMGLDGLHHGHAGELAPDEASDQKSGPTIKADGAAGQRAPFSYYDFAQKFGGSASIVRQLYEQYLDFFRGRERVVDLGCGRGTFLQLLTDNGIGAYGVELDSDLVRFCQGKGLDVVRADVIEQLRSLGDESLDGIFAGHVVEHLGAATAWEMLGLCYRKLEPGRYLVFETPNTLSLFVLRDMYFRDPTHRLPVHPETWEFLARSQGFSEVELRFSYPLPEGLELATIDLEAVDAPLRNQLALLNQNVENLNRLIFGYQNVAVIAKK